MALKLCVIQFLHGFKDSLFGFFKFFQRQKHLDLAAAKKQQQQPSVATFNNARVNSTNPKSMIEKSSEKLYQRLFQSCILNGIFLLSCILAFNHILIPILNFVFFKMITETYHNWITNYINPVIQFLFSFVWILPVFLLSKLFNLLVHQEIADCAYFQKYGKPQVFKNFTISQVIADTVFSATMAIIFLIQSSLMGLVPIYWLNLVLCHLHLSFLYSLYTFEYKLCNLGWDIKKRINYIESRWPYYFGFGLSQSLILACAGSYIYSATLFASIFPLFILSSVEADSEHLMPIVYYKEDPNFEEGFRPVQIKLPLFRFSLYLTDIIFKLCTGKQNKLNSNINQPPNVRSPINAQNRFNQAAAFTIRKTN